MEKFKTMSDLKKKILERSGFRVYVRKVVSTVRELLQKEDVENIRPTLESHKINLEKQQKQIETLNQEIAELVGADAIVNCPDNKITVLHSGYKQLALYLLVIRMNSIQAQINPIVIIFQTETAVCCSSNQHGILVLVRTFNFTESFSAALTKNKTIR